MVKKISAVLLALVLCFSVVVLPVSATGFDSGYKLPDGKRIAYKVEFDKEYYNAGDTVTVNVYFNVDTASQLSAGNIAFGVNDNVFDITTTNTAPVIKSSSTSSDLYTSFYNSVEEALVSWTKAKIIPRITAVNTAEENAAYNQYLRITISRNKNASHGNAGSFTAGLPGAEINAQTEPFFTFKLKIRDDVADGTRIQVGIPSGAIKANQMMQQAYQDGSTEALNFVQDAYDISQAVATATVGTPAPAGPVVSKAKSQVKMTATGAKTVADEFDFRVISEISDSDWDTYFKNTGVKDATTDYITAVGMVAYKGAAAFDAETAKKVVAGTPADDYTAATTNYISKANDTADAEFGAIIKTAHSTLANDVTYMGFVQYVDASGNAQTIFYETAGTAALSTNYNTIVSNYLTAYPYAA